MDEFKEFNDFDDFDKFPKDCNECEYRKICMRHYAARGCRYEKEIAKAILEEEVKKQK